MPDRDFWLSRLDRLYESYLETVEKLERNRKIGEGLLGLKGGPADDPCHDRFAEDIKGLLDAFAESGPDSSAVRALLERMVDAPRLHPKPLSAYWMLVAVQGYTAQLADRLTREDAAALAARFEGAYPRHERVPAQDTLLRQLRQRGGLPERRLFGFRK